MEQIDLPALLQGQGAQVAAQLADLQMGVADTLDGGFWHPRAACQDVLLVVGLDGQDVHAGKPVPDVPGVDGEHQLLPVAPPDQVAHRLPGIVESAEGDDLEAAHLHRL